MKSFSPPFDVWRGEECRERSLREPRKELASYSEKLGKKTVRETGSQVGRNNFSFILIKIKSKLPWAGSRQPPEGEQGRQIFPVAALPERKKMAQRNVVCSANFTSPEVKW